MELDPAAAIRELLWLQRLAHLCGMAQRGELWTTTDATPLKRVKR